MPPHTWPVEPIELIQQFEHRGGNATAGALFAWAAWAVECLHYLDDIDLAIDTSWTLPSGYMPDTVDVAHARWATTTCITALDLCAAGLGRAFCGQVGTHELDLGDFDQVGSPSARRQARCAHLPPAALQWIGGVLADPDYTTVKSARDWLTHSRLSRHFMLGAGTRQRLALDLPAGRLPVRQLIELARDLATRHVTAFLNVLPGL